MPISRHRRKKSPKNRKESQSRKPHDFVMMRHPLSTLPKDVLTNGLIEVGKKHQEEFPNKLAEAESLLQSVDPLLAISMLATYGLMGSVNDSGHISSGYKGETFNQSHVELAQALCLRIPSEQCSQEFPTPDVIQQLFDLLPELGDAYCLRRYLQLQEERSEEDGAARLIQELLRLHTQSVRNWGYFSRVAGIAKRICTPINDTFLAAAGICATDLIDLFVHLVRRSERLVSERLAKLLPVFRETTIAGTIDAYYKANLNFKESPAKMVVFAEENGVTLEQLKAMLLSHSDLSLSDTYTFDARKLAAEVGLDEKSVALAMDRLSIGLGGLAENNPEYFFLMNPVWTKPIVKLAGDQYFCAMPQAFFSFVFPILKMLLEGDTSATKRYENRRAEFLESDIRELFSKAFPDCEISTGYRWREGTDEYENDLMVRVDSHLILVEAKSQSVSWQALRGAPDRARRHVQEMLLEPSRQSLRLATRITQALSDKDNYKSLLPDFPVALDQVRTVLRLSVTLEDFATLQTTLHHAKNANWIPHDHMVAPCILLADLEIVFDILESTPHKIHYLKRRADLEANLDFKGNELDLLGFYLQTGFCIGDAEFSGDQYILFDMSKPIDRYFTALEEGIVTTKPTPKITNWWRDICKKTEERDIHQWSDVAIVLLGASLSDQEALAKKFKQVVKNVHKNWRVCGHNNSVVLVPSRRAQDAIAVFAFKEHDKDNRHANMENIAAQVFDESHTERCLVIGINLDKMHYPYSIIAVYFRHTDEG